MPYVVAASDSFNRSNGALTGSALDHALGGSGSHNWGAGAVSVAGGWADIWSTASNLASEPNTNGAIDSVAYVSTLAYLTDQRISATVNVMDSGVIARRSGNTFYLFYAAGGAGTLFYWNGSTFSSLGSVSGSISAGATLTLECTGTTLVCSINGSVGLTTTHGTIASGAPGLYAGGDGSAKTFDAFVVEAPSTAPVAIALPRAFQAVHRAAFY